MTMTTISFRSEAFARGARMLRTALGPSISGYLEDPSIVEVMLNPDGRLWIDRLSGGLEDTRLRVTPADAERIVRLVAHHVGVEVHAGSPARLRRTAGKRGAFRGPGSAGGRGAVLRHSPPGRRRLHPRRLCRGPHHVRPSGRAPARGGPGTEEHPRRRRHFDRQDDAGQCAPRRSRRRAATAWS